MKEFIDPKYFVLIEIIVKAGQLALSHFQFCETSFNLKLDDKFQIIMIVLEEENRISLINFHNYKVFRNISFLKFESYIDSSIISKNGTHIYFGGESGDIYDYSTISGKFLRVI